MANASLGPQLSRRKRLVTRLVLGALGATVIAVAVGYWWGASRKEAALPTPPVLPSNIHQQSSGYTFTRSDEGRRIFTVHAKRTVAFKQGGTTVLEDVYVEFFGQTTNRHDVLRTQRCDYNPQSGELSSAGKVEIDLNAPGGDTPMAADRRHQSVHLETSGVSFTNRGSLVASEETVRFEIESMSGSARGVAYAVKDGWLELKHDVAAELRLTGSGEIQSPVRLAASRMRYDKGRNEITLWGPLQITQGTRRVVAEHGTLALDGRQRLERAVLEGGVRGFDPSATSSLEFSASEVRGDFDPGTQQLRSLVAEGDAVAESRRGAGISRLRADKFQLALAGIHPQPVSASASGNAQLTLEPAPTANKQGSEAASISGDRKILTAAEMQFTFRVGAHSLEGAETVGESKLQLVPVDAKVGERVVTADQLTMAFDTRSRLESVHAQPRTHVVFKPPPVAPLGAVSQETFADRLDAAFDAGTGNLQTLEQTGDFQFREGDRQASSERARFDASTRSLTLVGRPQVWDANTRVKAERVLLDLRADTAEGVGKVQATHLEATGDADHNRSGPKSAGTGDPLNILADRMLAAHREQFIHYEGHVRAWRGGDLVESSSLDAYRTERRLASGFRVQTSHLQHPAQLAAPNSSASGPSRRETQPVTIRADRLEYMDEGRKASYRGNVELLTENTTLKADHLEVYFSKGANVEASEIERAVAEGHVAVTQQGRRAAGEHADYDAASGKIVLTGGPPTLYDAENGFTTGQRLTFYIRDDRLLVDGGNNSPTLSKHRVAQ